MVLLDVAGRVDPGVGPVIEAVLGALGDADGPPDADAVAEDRRYTLSQDPYAALWPGLAIVLTVAALNAIADGVRDATSATKGL